MKRENTFIHTLKSIWLCLKYPFLYPRNRFTGRHYDNWKLESFINGDRNLYKGVIKDGLFQKAYKFEKESSENFSLRRITINRWYAILYQICNFIYEYPMQWIHGIPTYTEWDAMDSMPGWKKAFGEQYLKDLKAQLKKDHFLYKFRITDIKEKYGTLRLYCACASDAVYRLIDKYEDLSYNTCIECGAPAKIITDGYILPYCEHCWASLMNPYKIGQYKIDGEHWVDADEIEVVPQNKKDE